MDIVQSTLRVIGSQKSISVFITEVGYGWSIRRKATGVGEWKIEHDSISNIDVAKISYDMNRETSINFVLWISKLYTDLKFFIQIEPDNKSQCIVSGKIDEPPVATPAPRQGIHR